MNVVQNRCANAGVHLSHGAAGNSCCMAVTGLLPTVTSCPRHPWWVRPTADDSLTSSSRDIARVYLECGPAMPRRWPQPNPHLLCIEFTETALLV